MGSWRIRLLLQAFLSLFQEMWLNSQPVLMVRLARLYGFSRFDAAIPAASMAGSAAIVEGIASIIIGNSSEASLLFIVAGVLTASGGGSLVFLVDDLFLGLIFASTIYGVGIGLTRALTSHCRDGIISQQLHFNREVGAILGGFVGAPLLFVLDDLLLTKGALLIVSGISLHSLAVVCLQYRAQWQNIEQSSAASASSTCSETQPRECRQDRAYPPRDGCAAEPLLDKPIELERMESQRAPPSLTIIDGRIPYAAQRKHHSQDLGYRQRVNSLADRELHSVSHHVLERPARRRLNTEPSDSDQNYNLVQKLIFAPERSISVDILHNNSLSPIHHHRINQTNSLKRSASQNSELTLTPIEAPMASHVAMCQVLHTGAFSLLVFTFISNSNLFIICSTLLDSYMDKANLEDSSLFAVDGIDPICIFLIFVLAKLVGTLVTDTLLRNYDASEKSIVLFANFIGGFNLLATPFLNRFLLIAGWAGLLGLVEGVLHFIQPNILRIYLHPRIELVGRAMTGIITGVYIGLALPLFAHHYRDRGESPSYDLLYQIFGLLQLAVSYNWLFLEPFFDKPAVSNEDNEVTGDATES